jgi:flagellum-specific ATP synthase
VFNEIPKLCERCGTSESGGSITALYTVLVEGDDFNEPISDTLRATLDGHLILTRELAHDGHFPAVDPLQSNSRLMGQIVDDQRQRLATEAVQILATYRRNQSLIELGAYRAGASEEIDRAIELWPRLRSYLRQGTKERISAATSIAVLTAILGGEAP